jgi:hypothetical protein
VTESIRYGNNYGRKKLRMWPVLYKFYDPNDSGHNYETMIPAKVT